jgi:hypothetical protein
MSHPVRVLERVVLRAPLGVRFLDTATLTPVRSGLHVTARRVELPSPPDGRPWDTPTVPLVANRSGVFVLPGPSEHDDVARPLRRYAVEVRDRDGRFLPVRFSLDYPTAPYEPFWGGLESSTAGDLPAVWDSYVPLFSAPGRLVPAGLAALRADVAVQVASPAGAVDCPASWALLHLALPPGQPDGAVRVVYGLSDELGRATLLFPYPLPEAVSASAAGGSQVGPPRPLWEHEWTLQLAAFHASDQDGAPPPSGSGTAERFCPHPSSVPDLETVLAQPRVHLVGPAGAVETLPVTLRYGQELLVRSPNPHPPPAELPLLRIESP